MAGENLLFRVDTLVVDGKPVAFEDGSARLSGAARFENELRPSASGDDFASRRRVPTTVTVQLQFNSATDPASLAGQTEVQITLRDQQSGRRALLPKCMFGSLGEIGGGSVQLTYLVLAPVQWL
jgi:hypothetical protein